jgi:hypothetical protein
LSFDMKEVNVPVLSEPIVYWEPEPGHGVVNNNPSIKVERYILVYWPDVYWPSVEDTMSAISGARARFGPERKIVVSSRFPKQGDKLMDAEFV